MKKIAVIGNLPSGGGSVVFNYQIRALKRKYVVNVYNNCEKPSNKVGIIIYYIKVIYDLIKNIKLSREINKNYSLLLAYQSWLTKSPIIFPLIKIPIIYICNEIPREHYDKLLRSKFSIKEMIINNILLLPIMIIDFLNIVMARNNLTIITLSKNSSELIKKVYKIIPIIIYPGIPVSKFNKHTVIHNRKNQIITVGAINKVKNQLFVLEVVSNISKHYRPKVVIVGNGGDGGYIQELKEYARIHKINLEIRTCISRKDLIKIYRESKALMYSPINEPFGLVVIEAMQAGLPIIVSKDGGGYSEIVNNRNGYILENKPKLWANKYKNLLLNSDIWLKYSQYNVNHSKKFTATKSALRLLKCIETII
ncbi:MAG: hypothetical protein Fur0011_5280 [Candidatus Microgenomates bacterium]